VKVKIFRCKTERLNIQNSWLNSKFRCRKFNFLSYYPSNSPFRGSGGAWRGQVHHRFLQASGRAERPQILCKQSGRAERPQISIINGG